MPEGDIMRILAVYQLLEKMGVNRNEQGAEYVAFMVRRLLNDSCETLESLYASAAKRFKSTPQEVKNSVLQAQIKVNDCLTSVSARFDPELGKIMTKCFGDNPFNIKDAEKFLEGIMKVLKE